MIAGQTAGVIDIPAGQDSLANGRVINVNFEKRLAEIEIQSIRTIEGTELHFNKDNRQTTLIPITSGIHYQNNLSRWISLRDIKPGHQVSISARPTEEGSKIWSSRRLIIQQPDPSRPSQEVPYPQNLLPIDADKVTSEVIKVPMLFPIAGKSNWSDTFLASRSGGRRHRGQDIFGKKLTPLVACFDGKVIVETNQGNAGNVVTIIGDNGYTAQYYHLNNDTPGTDDGKGTELYAFAPGLKTGDRVLSGQLVGWLGDSGNAESTAPHLHFELWHQDTKACYNARPSLYDAVRIDAPIAYIPFPDLVAGPGRLRLDGTIKGLDKTRNVLVLDLLAEQNQNQASVVVSTPNRRYIRCGDQAHFSTLSTGESLKMENLAIGQSITVFVENAKPGESHALARGWVNTQDLVASNPKLPEKPKNSTPINPSNSIVIKSGSSSSETGSAGISSTHQIDLLLKELNAFRSTKNLPNLVGHQILSQSALSFSIRMMDGDFFDVYDSRARLSATDIAKREGYSKRVRALISSKDSISKVAAEIIAAYPDILSDKAIRHLGLGYSYLDFDPGSVNVKNYWTILFGE